MAENWFFGKGISTFMCTGYRFMSCLEKSRQLSWNLPRDAYHYGSIRELKKETLQFPFQFPDATLQDDSETQG